MQNRFFEGSQISKHLAMLKLPDGELLSYEFYVNNNQSEVTSNLISKFNWCCLTLVE